MVEMLAVPLLRQSLGGRVEPEALAVARSAPPDGLEGPHARFLDLLRAGRPGWDEVAREQFERAPSAALWSLALIAHARASGDAKQLDAALARARVALRYSRSNLWALGELARLFPQKPGSAR
jgi:hypothetical protein